VSTFAERYVQGDPMAVFDLLRSRITKQVGVKRSDCEDLALAIASLAFGTAQGMSAAGTDTRNTR